MVASQVPTGVPGHSFNASETISFPLYDSTKMPGSQHVSVEERRDAQKWALQMQRPGLKS